MRRSRRTVVRAGKPLREQVMVITGATSGIGLATVRATAKAGAKLVLVARGQPDLREICAGIAADGALFVVADVLASKQAIAHFSELRPGSWMFF